MIFEFGGQAYKIWFKYEGDWKHRETVCLIDRVGLAGVLSATFAVGSSLCAASDQFCKETGRKIALTRALKSAPAKRFRTAAWQAYRARAVPAGLKVAQTQGS